MDQAPFFMLIDGRMVAAEQTIDVLNPADRTVIAQAPDCSRDQLDAAVGAARLAYPAWRAMPEQSRADIMNRAAAVIREHADELMRLLTSEQGKPHAAALHEVTGAARWLEALAATEIPVETNEDGPERLSQTRHVPLGVVAAISPWNFPVSLSFWKIAPALRAGNTMVLKPSPFTPLTMLRIGELLAGVFPAGVLNIVSGGDALGPWMTAHPGVNKISFTGSTPTGRRVMASAAGDLKRITLELGGNDAAIVMPDVDVDEVAQELFWAAFRNNGQLCVATKRLYVHADIYDRLAEALVTYARTVKVGNGAEQGTDLGPIQNKAQFDRVVGMIEDSRQRGHRFLLGGDIDADAPGYFIPVTIVDNPEDDARVVKEEAFGPVLPLLRFEAVDEVIARANDTEYGLAGSVWSADVDAALAIAARLETGTVWINEAHHFSPHQPFAGHKQSGFGVENGLGGLLEYTVPQTVTVRRRAA